MHKDSTFGLEWSAFIGFETIRAYFSLIIAKPAIYKASFRLKSVMDVREPKFELVLELIR